MKHTLWTSEPNSSGTEVIQHLRLIGQKAFGQSPVGFHFGQAVIA